MGVIPAGSSLEVMQDHCGVEAQFKKAKPHRVMCVKILLVVQWLISGFWSLSSVLVWWINYSFTLELF